MEYIETAWKVYKRSWLAFIAAEIIAAFLSGIFLIIGIGVFLSTLLISLGVDVTERGLTEELMTEYVFPSLFSKTSLIIHPLLYASVFFLVSVVISKLLNVGMYAMALDGFRKRTRVRLMFRAAIKYGFRALGCDMIEVFIILSLLTGAAVTRLVIPVFGTIIALLMVIPTLYVALLFSLTSPAIVVDKCGVLEAVKKSVYAVRRRTLTLIGLMLILLLAAMTINTIPWVGVVLSMLIVSPLQKIILVGFYRKNRPRKI